MLLASFGIAKRGFVPRELSAVVVIACGSAIVLVLLVLSTRLFLKRGVLPFSPRAAIALVGISVVSPLVLWGRYEGVFTPLVFAMCLINALCVVAGALAILAARRHVPDAGSPH
ncbi:hypothetical protein [Microbacterium sp. 2RAF4]|uniref:hypothetical protein n=1 Tax=Microbacterium sp. 2RAF4 TaxID=3232999 RepID=UPI003F9CCC6D